jgi:hypothetical protein
MSKFAEAKRHTIKRILSTKIRQNPFTHTFIENAFPPAFDAKMQPQYRAHIGTWNLSYVVQFSVRPRLRLKADSEPDFTGAI